MRYLICVDDTDDLTKETSTGKIANMIAKNLEKEFGMTINKGVTRHQLLLKEGVPYTSHNSAMCIDVSGDISIDEIKDLSIKTVLDNMAKSSDPGICICNADKLKRKDELIKYGIRAQNEIIKKDEAINLINEYDCIFGKELGGNGQGIIGAVAGIGLRLSGNDGTFRGKIKFPKEVKQMSVKNFKEDYKIDDVIDLKTKAVLEDEIILQNKSFAKLLFRNNKKLAVATEIDNDKYLLCNKNEAMDLDNKSKVCENFVFDNDANECLTEDKSCLNCLYRRFTKDGFICTYK